MDSMPIVYDIRNNEWTTQFKRNTSSTHSIATTVPSVADSTINIAAIGGGIAVVVTMALIGIFFYMRRVTGRKRMDDESNKDTIVSPRVREPQDPGGDLESELLRSRYPWSSPPLYSRPMYYQDEFFKLLSASPLVGPHAFMKDPQGQQHRSTSSDEVELEGEEPCSGSKEFNHWQSSSSTPRSPQLVDHAPTTLQELSSNGDGDNSDDDDDKCEETAHSNPRSPQSAMTDGQGGPAPQWQHLLPIAFPYQKQSLDRSQVLVRMMNAIRAEQIELEKSVLVQDALAARKRAAYSDTSQPILCSNKK